MKTLPFVVVMLLVALPVLGAVGPTSGSPRSSVLGGATYAQVGSPSNEMTHVLDTPSPKPVRSTIEAHHVDLDPSLDSSALRVDGRTQTGASLERIESVSDDSTRRQFILDELNDIGQRAIALQNARCFVIKRFNGDNLTARELPVELARIDAEVRAPDERRVVLRDVANRVSDFSVGSGRLATLEREFDTPAGPVRTHAVTVMTSEADATWFSVQTSEAEVVLSVVADGEYVRETYRADLHDRDQHTVTYEGVLDIVMGNYPTIYSSCTAQNGTSVISTGDNHRVRVNYNYGQLTAYVDTGSGRTSRESQTRPFRSISTTTTATGVRDGLAFTVDRTCPGGPLRIQLNENKVGGPVDANVAIGLETGQENTLLGHTGPDGMLWTVSPSAPYTTTVIKGNSAVVFTTDPTPTPTFTVNPTDTKNDTSLTVTSTPTESIESSGPSRMVPQSASGDSPTVGSPTVG